MKCHRLTVAMHAWPSWCVSSSQLFLSLCVRDVAVPFVAATGAAVGTGIYLNKVVAKVTVWLYILLMVY